MEYEWDPDKAKSNFAKHRISFTAAATALRDPNKIEDLDEDHGEERNQVLCMHPKGLVLFVVTTELDPNVGRIISARRANRNEQERYFKARSL
jgi:uncharacterized DUF497 family protein